MRTKRKYIFAFLLILLLSCKKERVIIDEQNIEPILMIDRYIEDFYKINLMLPNSQDALFKEYENQIETFFVNHFQKKSFIKYIPVIKDNEYYPSAYYIISTDKKDIKKISSDKEDEFINTLITACEYNNGKEGDIILSYGNPYLVTSSIGSFSLQEASKTSLSQKVYYNIVFKIDSLKNKNDKLNFSLKKDSITIKGNFYNELVRNKVFERLEANSDFQIRIEISICADNLLLQTL